MNLLPKTNANIYVNMCCKHDIEMPIPVISNSIHHFLCNIKKNITNMECCWDIYKKYTNTYEYIHTNIPYKNKCVSKYRPLSRSFYKLIEIINTFKLLSTIPAHQNIRSFHLAEGPGGFIEALSYIRKNENDVYTGITLLNDANDPNIPTWKKSRDFLNKHPNVIIENGIDKTGNILSFDNFKYCVEKYGSSMDIVTGDGGFDFSNQFNEQEINMAKLLFSQMAFGICLQKLGGTFILKIFDTFMAHTIDILYLLSSFYETVYITKPNTSRMANSEKYVVCHNFLFENADTFYPFFKSVFLKMTHIPENEHIHRFLNIRIPSFFLKKIEELNGIMCQKQIHNIYYTICLVDMKLKTDKIDHLIKTNVQKSIEWCNKNKIDHYDIFHSSNVFLSK
jgi:23S rRNA U2552 (ribose-2'-O)-methylase RlmE/FtsJ